MKATMGINDALLDAARKIVERDGMTLRSLVEDDLRYVVAGRQAQRALLTMRAAAAGDRGAVDPRGFSRS